MPATLATLGLYGLGTMGSALALNILDHGFALHVANRSPDKTPAFITEAGPLAAKLTGHTDLAAMAAAMPMPRAIILMVQAGDAVDQAIAALTPHLSKGDAIIDAGNAMFHDTRRRTAALEATGLTFIGMGVSGGEEGARNGPAIMAGGTKSAYEGIRPVLEAIAAKFKGQPCAAHLGPDGAGHFVKTVHNGIEYADMQMIAEAYGLMRYGMGQSPAAMGATFTGWNTGPLQSYLIEITGAILAATDRKTGLPAVDIIVDSAGQKGTGRWTVIEALTLGQSASTIEAAVGARAWSAERATRAAGQSILGLTRGPVTLSETDLEQALLATRIIGYAQGFRLLATASDTYTWSLDMAQIAEVWRAGCIIRSALLDDIATAFRSTLPENQLIFAPAFTQLLKTSLPALRQVSAAAISAAHPIPVMSAALSWIDSMGQGRGTTDLTQAQRDFFGMHGFERMDDGTKGQHGPWWD